MPEDWIRFLCTKCHMIHKTISDLLTNEDIQSYDTRYKNLFRIPKDTINSTSLNARLWNILNFKIYVHVQLSKFKSGVRSAINKL